MRISDFDISSFIDNEILVKGKEEHQYEDRKASSYRQVKDLFKKCSSGSGHVLGDFPIERFNGDEISKFLRYILRLKDLYGREIVSQMDKVNINSESDKWINVYEALDDYVDDMRNSGLFKSCVLLSRDIIRKRPGDYQELINLNQELFVYLLSEPANLYDIGRYLNFSENIILQTVIYWIVSNDGVDETMKKDFIIELEQVIDDLDQEISFVISEGNGAGVNIDEAIIIFMLYLKERNYFGEYVKILNKLAKEELTDSDFFSEVRSCYKVDKDSVVDEKMIQDVITEGRPEYDFDRKLTEAREIIRVFGEYLSRAAHDDNILDMKVYFREIFLSKSKYTRQAKSIMRKYLAQYNETGDVASFELDSESLFIREKINRGYFRECGGLASYNEKNVLQVKLFKLLQKVHLLYCYDESIKFIFAINMHYLNRISDLMFGQKEKK